MSSVYRSMRRGCLSGVGISYTVRARRWSALKKSASRCGAAASISTLWGERLWLRAGFDVSRQEYEGRDFDRFSVAGHFGPRWLTSANTEVSLLASARQDWIRTAPDHRDVGARIEMGHRLTPRVAVNGRASWHRREYRPRGVGPLERTRSVPCVD